MRLFFLYMCVILRYPYKDNCSSKSVGSPIVRFVVDRYITHIILHLLPISIYERVSNKVLFVIFLNYEVVRMYVF